jgi:hypothetical protein
MVLISHPFNVAFIAMLVHMICHVKSIDSANVEFTGSVSDLVERPVGRVLA